MRTPPAVWLVTAAAVAANLPAPRERSFSFEYTVTVKGIPNGARTVDIWLPEPHDDAFQHISDLRVDTPYHSETATGFEDNRILHLRVSDPREPIAVTMRFSAVRKEHLQPYRPPPPQTQSCLKD